MSFSFDFGNIRPLVSAIPHVPATLSMRDHLGTLRVRLGIRRNSYRVAPGLYAIGKPDSDSDVLVTANYKLSFDTLRSNLKGLSAWILVLDTKGINVWCAAGKKTFGTTELIKRMEMTSLDTIVQHRRIILPQLGAPGVAAYKVKEKTGFTVVYGPVRAADIRAFLDKGYRATKEMRKVQFNLKDRAVLIPVDFIGGKTVLLVALVLITLISGLTHLGVSAREAIADMPRMLMNVFAGYVSGIVLTPMLLPYIPLRAFAGKGSVTGFMLSSVLLMLHVLGTNPLEEASWFLLIAALSSFMAMNFTGSSTYTSLSGVKREMRIAVPLQVLCGITGLILLTVSEII
jgi:hypothetical protein